MAKKTRRTAVLAATALAGLSLVACGQPEAVPKSVYEDAGAFASTLTQIADEVPEIAPSVPAAPNSDSVPAVNDDDPTQQVERDNVISVWDGDLEAAGWLGGGTKPDGYVEHMTDAVVTSVDLNDAAALAYFSHEVYAHPLAFSGVTVNLNCDVDLGSKMWIPIGMDGRKSNNKSLVHAFRGVFDGKGHTVSGINGNKFFQAVTSFDSTKYEVVVKVGSGESDTVNFGSNDDFEVHYGLFGTTVNATVKNLTVENFTLDAEPGDLNLLPDSIGAIIGFAGGNLTVVNCTAGEPGDKTVAVKNTAVAGGIVGRAYGSVTNTGTEEAPVYKYDGGGTEHCDLEFTNCTNYLSLGVIGDTAQKAGILGYANGQKKMKYAGCKNYGNMVSAYTGGITAFVQQSYAYNLEMIDCENHGDITANSISSGGIIGRIHTDGLSECEITLQNVSNYGKVSNIKNEAMYSSSLPYQVTGGIGGYIGISADGTKFISKNVYNYGEVTGAAKLPDTTGQRQNSVYTAAGGIFGTFYVSEGNASIKEITDKINAGTYNPETDYPYKEIVFDFVNCAKVSNPDTYRGKKMYIGGVFGMVEHNQVPTRRYVKIKANTLVNTYGIVKDIDYTGKSVEDNREIKS